MICLMMLLFWEATGETMTCDECPIEDGCKEKKNEEE